MPPRAEGQRDVREHGKGCARITTTEVLASVPIDPHEIEGAAAVPDDRDACNTYFCALQLLQTRRTKLCKRKYLCLRVRIALIIASKANDQRLRAQANGDAYIALDVGFIADAGQVLGLGAEQFANCGKGLGVYRSQGNVDPVGG